MARLRVLVVDDSAFMRSAIARLLESDARFSVVGQGKDGHDAVRLAKEVRPDVITMDYNMPGLNGVAATKAILAERAVPIVMLSAHTSDGARETLAALAAGAFDFVTKPDGEVSVNLGVVKDELFEKLVAAAGAKVQLEELEPVPDSQTSSRRLRAMGRHLPAGLRLVAIGALTGGPAALSRLMPKLAVDENVAVVVVQHLPAGYTAALARQLDDLTSYPVAEVEAGELVVGGKAYVARGDFHLGIGAGRFELGRSAPEHGVRPAVDPLFHAVAKHYGARAIGVLLTGMGRDGALGLAAIKAAGGWTLAQDEASSVVFGMPKAAVQLGVVDSVAPLERIATLVNRLLSPAT